MRGTTTFGCFLAAVSAAASVSSAAVTRVLPFQEIETVDPLRQTAFHVGAGEVDQPLTSFGTTELRPATMRSWSLLGNGADIYDTAGGRSRYFLVSQKPSLVYYYRPQLLIAELLAGTAPGVTLTVGYDSNGDGQPQANEATCQVVFASAAARCVFATPIFLNHSYWVMASAPSGTGASYAATVSAGLPEVVGSESGAFSNGSGGDTDLEHPGSTDPGEPFAIDMQWLHPLAPLQRYYGAVLMGKTDVVGSFCCAGNVDALIPFALEDASAYPIMIDAASGPLLLTPPQQGPVLGLPPGQTSKRLFFDLPASASPYDSIVVIGRVVSGPGSTPTPNLELSLVRNEFPPSSPSAALAPAPLDMPPVVRWNLTTNDTDVTATLAHPVAGRWYVVATNKGDDPIAFNVRIADSNPANTVSGFGRGANPLIVPGNYFNPQRSGHGISISQAVGQQLLFWYTYLPDGTPAWYLAQAAAPPGDSGWWASPLYQVHWNGSAGTPTQAGYVELAPTAANRLMFTWHLADASGSETFELLASGRTCVDIDGAATNLSGNWFAPAQSGYGVDVLALPTQQFDIFYFYDAAGAARWGIGAAPFATSSTLDMLQSTGFCPLCDYMPVTTRALGRLTIQYADTTSGLFATDFTLQAPLQGTWNIAQPMIRLTGSNSCQ